MAPGLGAVPTSAVGPAGGAASAGEAASEHTKRRPAIMQRLIVFQSSLDYEHNAEKRRIADQRGRDRLAITRGAPSARLAASARATVGESIDGYGRAFGDFVAAGADVDSNALAESSR